MFNEILKMKYSYEDTDIAFNKVRNELFSLGILTKKIDDVDVEWQEWALGALINLKWIISYGLGSPSVMGFCTEQNRIYVPEFAWNRNVSVLYVLRHEFGHAYANAYPRLFSSRDFKKSFGDKYGDYAVYDDTCYWKEYCVSDYAATSTQEDFAETFMYYLKHKGRIPKFYKKNAYIESKWNFINIMIDKISALNNSK